MSQIDSEILPCLLMIHLAGFGRILYKGVVEGLYLIVLRYGLHQLLVVLAEQICGFLIIPVYLFGVIGIQIQEKPGPEQGGLLVLHCKEKSHTVI